MDSLLSSLKSIETMQENFDSPPKVLYENRYCNQDDFSVLVCGGKDQNDKLVKSVFKLDGSNFQCEEYTNMPKAFYDCKIAVINSDLFVFGGCIQNGECTRFVRKFCNKTKLWSCKPQPGIRYRVCSIRTFKQNFYVLGNEGPSFVYIMKPTS